MNFLKDNKRFSFLYGEKNITELSPAEKITETENSLISEYTLSDGLKITNFARKFDDFGAYEWVNYFENTGSKPTQIISELWDCLCEIPLGVNKPFCWQAYLPDAEKSIKIYAPTGSDWSAQEFYSDADGSENFRSNSFTNYIFSDSVKEYKASGGRSSEKNAPFFNIHHQGCGVIFAIGWTGQWNCRIEGTKTGAVIKTKIEDTHFRLLPGEKIRTSSIVIMPYSGNVEEAQNKWRRLVKNNFSLIGTAGREPLAPLCAGIWGGMSTTSVIDRINAVSDNNIPFEYFWMDAGWYGMDTKPSPDEFEGDWGSYTGDWRVNPHIHPDGLHEVSSAIAKADKKFLLWLEPERVVNNTPTAMKHPEYFIDSPYENDTYLLLNLGNPNAWEYCFNMLSEKISSLNISCYRQDFNMSPLEFWRKNDSADRKGISEIKHINGLYKLWDALLEKFPHLIIDNCASGGRRIDIETLRRSVPLWRSDAQCSADYPPEFAQVHNMTFSSWMPYSGTGSGRQWGDVYRIRSAYAGGLTTNYTYSEKEEFGKNKAQLEWIKKYTEEYLKIRPYFSCDFYPLTKPSAKTDEWSAVQFNRPELDDGVVQIFRRAQSPYTNASFSLKGLCADKTYIFTDADGGEEFEINGSNLIADGFCINIPQKRTAKIYFYHCK